MYLLNDKENRYIIKFGIVAFRDGKRFPLAIFSLPITTVERPESVTKMWDRSVNVIKSHQTIKEISEWKECLVLNEHEGRIIFNYEHTMETLINFSEKRRDELNE